MQNRNALVLTYTYIPVLQANNINISFFLSIDHIILLVKQNNTSHNTTCFMYTIRLYYILVFHIMHLYGYNIYQTKIINNMVPTGLQLQYDGMAVVKSLTFRN